MKEWVEISKTKPPYGELIWVWDNDKREKFLMRYFGTEETWIEYKNNGAFPIWAPVIKSTEEE